MLNKSFHRLIRTKMHAWLSRSRVGLRSMDTVWITGTLTTVRTDSYMGAASYRIEAVGVAPYSEPAR